MERRLKEFMARKLPMPVLALAGEKSNGMAELEMARELAVNLEGGVVPDTGHWTPDENPEFLADQLVRFFGHEQSGAR
jgi:pimeloyl-ACP methyl ester carboxylesterase